MTIDIVPGEAPRPRRRWSGASSFAVAGLLLLALGLWLRGLPAFVAWQVAADHQRCFGRRALPARVWSSEPDEVRAWLESRGTPTPLLPAEAAAAELVGARYCALEDRVAAHVYYAGQGGLVSVFLLSGPARIGDGWVGVSRGLNVRLLRAAGRTVAIVGQSAKDVAATARSFTDTVARGSGSPVLPRDRPDLSRRIRRCACSPRRVPFSVRLRLTGPGRAANLSDYPVGL
jgi:hypothetical protein